MFFDDNNKLFNNNNMFHPGISLRKKPKFFLKVSKIYKKFKY